MHRKPSLVWIVLLSMSCTRAFAQDAPSSKFPPLNQNYGRVAHPTSTKNPQAQRYFEQGMALYYGFNHDEAVRCFHAAATLDPAMSMAWWGMALSLGPNYNAGVDAEGERKAYESEQKAIATSSAASQKERDYVNALAARYSNDPKADYQQLSTAYSAAMHDLAAKYSDDLDAATLYAESLMDLHPWQLYRQDGTPAPGTGEIVRTLESVMKRDPNHLGANHFYIHAVEGSNRPQDALPSAQRLAGLAPESGHLVHMPGHIFIRTGDHLQSLETNRKAARVDEAFFERTGAEGGYEMYYMHNLHFIAVEAMFLGRSGEATSTVMKIHDKLLPHAAAMPMADGFVALPSQILVRLNRWDDVMKLPEPSPRLPFSQYMWHYSRAMAWASSGQQTSASAELGKMQKLAPEAAKVQINPVDAANTGRIMTITAELVQAKMAERENRPDDAIVHLKRAVTIQDQADYDEPQDWISPVRESLGGALLRAHRAAEAEAVFREDLQRNPKNPRSLFGLAESLRQQQKDDTQTRADFERAWQYADMKLKVDDL